MFALLINVQKNGTLGIVLHTLFGASMIKTRSTQHRFEKKSRAGGSGAPFSALDRKRPITQEALRTYQT